MNSRVHPHPRPPVSTRRAPSPIKREGELFARVNWSRWLRTALLYFVLTIMLILFMAPVYGAIVTAFKSQAEVSAGGYWTIPTNFASDNFERVMDPEDGNLGLYLGNSLLLTIPASLFSIALGTLAGYGLGKYNFKGDGLLFILIVAGMFLPPQIALIPVFRLMNDIGLYDTLWAVIIIHTAFGIPICTLVMRNFFQVVPNALREAALIDGANEYSIFFPHHATAYAAGAGGVGHPAIHLDLERLPLALHPDAARREPHGDGRHFELDRAVHGRLGRSGGGEFDRLAADAFHLHLLPALLYSRSDAGRSEGVIAVAHDSGRKTALQQPAQRRAQCQCQRSI